MCYSSVQYQDKVKIEQWHHATFEADTNFQPAIFTGFAFPLCPVISDADTHSIKMFQWGLIPAWAKDRSIRKNTLNAKIETLEEKPSFRNNIQNRCIVLVSGFYDWKWLDEKGKKKEKYEITLAGAPMFSMAGLYSRWTDRSSGEVIDTYTLVTTEANSLMAEIHNTKMRMPIVLNRDNEKKWLSGEDYRKFAKPDVDLVAKIV